MYRIAMTAYAYHVVVPLIYFSIIVSCASNKKLFVVVA